MEKPTTSTSEFFAGGRAVVPLLVGVAPFGMIYGALALGAGIPNLQAQAMSAIVFAGSSQFVTTQLVGEGAPGLVIVLTIAIINLRHALYSASVAPFIKHLPLRWKASLAYLLTDEAYAVTISHLDSDTPSPHKHWFFLGAGLGLWTTWQISTAAGILLGTVIPESWSLDFTLALTFIAMVVPALKYRPALASAIVAGLVAVACYSLPYKLWIMLAAAAGILTGVWLESRMERRK